MESIYWSCYGRVKDVEISKNRNKSKRAIYCDFSFLSRFSWIFSEMYHKKEFAKIGFTKEFVQDNYSCSKRGVLRGLHFQKKHPQEKLLRVLKGRILDVVLDLRMGSESFGKYFSIELSAENQKMLYIPAGMAHGFLSLEEDTKVFYNLKKYLNFCSYI